jgi:CRP-like cAMP-binding protein
MRLSRIAVRAKASRPGAPGILRHWAKVHLSVSAPICASLAFDFFVTGVTVANLDFTTTVVEPNDSKIFGTAETAVYFEKLFADDVSLQRTLTALQRGPVRFYRDSVVVFEDDLAEYLLFVVSGVVRRCKSYKNGSRNVVAFNLPGDLFGWTDVNRSLSIEAASDTEVLFLKRSSLLSLARRNVGWEPFCLVQPPMNLRARKSISC